MRATLDIVYMLSLFILSSTLYSCSSDDAPGRQNDTPPAQQAVKSVSVLPGHGIYTLRCAACHGSDGSAGVLGASDLQTITSDSTSMVQRVTSGKGSMPPFGKTLSAIEIQQVVQYAKTLRK